jgi:methyl-accepting chemotaxis protein
MNDQNNRTKWLHLRLKPDEYEKLYKEFSKTTCRKLSEYSRKILLGKPIIATHRNQSIDDLMTEAIKLRNELNGLGNNFNQAVKKLHTLQQIPEFRNWITTYETDRKTVLNKVEEIKNNIQKIAEKWLQ